jgi:bacteriocin-like protein
MPCILPIIRTDAMVAFSKQQEIAMNEAKFETNELSETELDQVTGGDALDNIDLFLQAFVGTDGHGNGPINHFRDTGSHKWNPRS